MQDEVVTIADRESAASKLKLNLNSVVSVLFWFRHSGWNLFVREYRVQSTECRVQSAERRAQSAECRV